jgi:hypothetical protein
MGASPLNARSPLTRIVLCSENFNKVTVVTLYAAVCRDSGWFKGNYSKNSGADRLI